MCYSSGFSAATWSAQDLSGWQSISRYLLLLFTATGSKGNEDFKPSLCPPFAGLLVLGTALLLATCLRVDLLFRVGMGQDLAKGIWGL